MLYYLGDGGFPPQDEALLHPLKMGGGEAAEEGPLRLAVTLLHTVHRVALMVFARLLGWPPLHCGRRPRGAKLAHHPLVQLLESGGREPLRDVRPKVHREVSLRGHPYGVYPGAVNGRFAFERIGGLPSILALRVAQPEAERFGFLVGMGIHHDQTRRLARAG